VPLPDNLEINIYSLDETFKIIKSSFSVDSTATNSKYIVKLVQSSLKKDT
jgi:hypothetical protein